jgi:hypothetical protein
VPGALERITIEPAAATVVAPDGFSFTAIGHYPDGRTLNVTQQVEWLSLDRGIARARNSPGDRSHVTGLKAGTARVVAVHPSGVSSLESGAMGLLTVKGIARLRLEPGRQTVRAGTTTRLTLVADLEGGGTLNLTQRARYDVYFDWQTGPLAEAPNAGGDRSAIRLLAPGRVDVQAMIADDYAHAASAVIDVVP